MVMLVGNMVIEESFKFVERAGSQFSPGGSGRAAVVRRDDLRNLEEVCA